MGSLPVVLRCGDVYVTVPLNSYNGQSISILFELFKGNSMALDNCNVFQVLADMMMFCNKYDIQSPIQRIEAKILEIGVNMDNLLKMLEMLDSSGSCHQFNDLYDKCLDVAKQNLDSQQKLVEFLLDNKSYSEMIITRLYENLFSGCNEFISLCLPDVTEMGETVRSETYVVRDTPFHIEVQPHRWVKGVRKIGFFLRCEDKDAKYEDWMINCVFGIHSREEDVFCEKTWFPDPNAAEIGFDDFMNYNDLVDKRNGYVPKYCNRASLDVTVMFNYSNDPIRKVVAEDKMGFVDVIANQFFLTHFAKEENIEFFTAECGMWCGFCGDDHFIPRHNNKKGVNVRIVDNPVIIECDNVIVAIAKEILTEESGVFKRMLSNTWTGPDSEYESSEDDSPDVNSTTVIKPLKRRVEVIEITKFSPAIVRTLFEFLKGHKDIMDEIHSFSGFGELMMLCDFYAIDKPINVIVLEMIELSITMDNILEAFATAKSLEVVDAYKDVAQDLAARCVAFVRCNLGCWVSTLDFITRSQDNSDLCLQLLQVLRDETETCVRMKIEDFRKNIAMVEDDKERELVSCPVYMFRGATWTVSILQSRHNKEDVLGFHILCEDQCSYDWSCDLTMELRLYNWKTGMFENSSTGPMGRSFTGYTCIDAGKRNVIDFKTILDESKGFLKNDTVLVEVKITDRQK